MKKIMLAGLVIVGGWFLYSILQPPVWGGETSNGEWKVVYYQDNPEKDTWEGLLYWDEKGEGALDYLQYSVNGKGMTERKNRGIVKEKVSFVGLGIRYNKSDSLLVELKWTDDNGQNHEESVQLKYKKRLFITPNQRVQ